MTDHTANIPIEAISTAPAELTKSSSSEDLAKLEAQLLNSHQNFQSELGWIGKVIGGRSEKPGNISLIVLVLVIIAIFCLFFMPVNEAVDIGNLSGGLLSIVTLVLGYLFGSNDKDGPS